LAATNGHMDVKVVIMFNGLKLQLELLCGIHHRTATIFRIIIQLTCQKQMLSVKSSVELYWQLA